MTKHTVIKPVHYKMKKKKKEKKKKTIHFKMAKDLFKKLNDEKE